MLMASVPGLNLGLGFDNSSQNFVMQTMVNQEAIFKNQISSSGFAQNHYLKNHKGPYGCQQISLDLNLAGSQYTNDSGNLSCDYVAPNESSLLKLDIYNDNQSSIDMIGLSLRAGADAWQEGSSRKTCKDKGICSPSLQPIHLEGSTYGGAHTAISSRGYASHSRANNGLVASCSSTSRKNDSFDWIQETQSFRDGRANNLERGHFYQGAAFNKSLLETSYEVGELDLNKASPDESFVHPTDSWILNSSQCTSSGDSLNDVGGNDEENRFTVFYHRQQRNNYSTKSSPRKHTSDRLCKSTLCSVDLGSVGGPLLDYSDQARRSRNFRPKSTESKLHLLDNTSHKIPASEVNFKKKKEEDKLCSHYSRQELVEGTNSNRSPVSCKSDFITDDESSNTKAGQSLIGIPKFSVNVMPHSEKKSQSSDPRKAEVDQAVEMGAVSSLLYFSVECLSRNHVYKKRKESCNVESEAPEASSDSYESIVLKQQECSVDEYCVSSTPFKVTGLDKKNSGVKLKRGRRMKDFRKEILPGLPSLSRQEINEDVKIMKLALRSRDYKKHRSTPLGNKR